MKGFTLVETLVAITVVLLAVMGPFQLVKDSLTTSYVARDQLIATALAEEGLEYVRSIRDNNYLYTVVNPATPRAWFYGLDGSTGPNCFLANGCVVDPPQATVTACGGTCPVMNLGSDTLYTQRSGVGYTATRFTRKVLLEDIGTNREVKATVTVTFSTRHTPLTITVTDTFYNWL